MKTNRNGVEVITIKEIQEDTEKITNILNKYNKNTTYIEQMARMLGNGVIGELEEDPEDDRAKKNYSDFKSAELASSHLQANMKTVLFVIQNYFQIYITDISQALLSENENEILEDD